MGIGNGNAHPGGWQSRQLGLESCLINIFPLAGHFPERALTWSLWKPRSPEELPVESLT